MKNGTEKEIAFIFKHEDAMSLLKYYEKLFCDVKDESDRIYPLESKYFDRYISKNKRIRKELIGKNGYNVTLTEKIGLKTDYERTERSIDVNLDVFDFFESNSVLDVVKNRFVFNLQNNVCISIDLVESPMKIGIIEIEAPTHELINEYRTKMNLNNKTVCSLRAFDYFKRKIAICGTSSSGKSETAKKISSILNCEYKCNSFHVIEYATTFIQKYRRIPTLTDEFFIWLGQRERENSASSANIVISDCPTFLTYIYMLHYKNKNVLNSESSMYFAKIYKRVLQDSLNYSDLIFLQLQEYNENGIRYQSKQEALVIQEKIHSFLNDHNIKFTPATYNDTENLINNLFYINKV